MSRAEPQQDDRRAAEQTEPEPSMEEILASIRRILAEGQGLWGGSQASSAEPDEPEPDPRFDKLVAAPDGKHADGHSVVRQDLRRPAAVDRSLTNGSGRYALASATTEASVAAALQALVASRFIRNTDLLSDLVREMIRPMLAAWIDENLPRIVERLVAAEIARIARDE